MILKLLEKYLISKIKMFIKNVQNFNKINNIYLNNFFFINIKKKKKFFFSHKQKNN